MGRKLNGCGIKTKTVRENNKLQIFTPSWPELRYQQRNCKGLAQNEIKCIKYLVGLHVDNL